MSSRSLLSGEGGDAGALDLFLYLSKFTSEEHTKLWLELQTSPITKLTISLRGYSPIPTLHSHPLFDKRHSVWEEFLLYIKFLLGYGTFCSEFATALRINTQLRELDLSLNQIGYSGAAELGQVLRENKTLQRLNLADNNLGNRGAECIAAGLRHNATLQYLNLSSNLIEQVQVLTQCLMENTSLLELDLSCNRIDNTSGAQSIAQLLRVNTTLQVLCLECTQLGDAGVDQLALGLISNNTLIKLDLSHNEVRDFGCRHLCFALCAGGDALREVNLFGNHLSDAGGALLLRLLATQHRQPERFTSLLGVNLGANPGIRAPMRRTIKRAFDAKRNTMCILALLGAKAKKRETLLASPLRRLPFELFRLVRECL